MPMTQTNFPVATPTPFSGIHSHQSPALGFLLEDFHGPLRADPGFIGHETYTMSGFLFMLKNTKTSFFFFSKFTKMYDHMNILACEYIAFISPAMGFTCMFSSMPWTCHLHNSCQTALNTRSVHFSVLHAKL